MVTTVPRSVSSIGDTRSAAEQLRSIAAAMPGDADADRYGGGARVAALESSIAALLGKPAAVFAPSGKALQNGALRAHADKRARSAIAAHPRSHIVEDENGALEALFGLRIARIGAIFAPFIAAEIAAVTDPLAAVVVELPLRRADYRITPFDGIVAMRDITRERGAAFHLDGARLWECAPAYGKTPAELAAPFDSVYVSFYKGLGGLAGGALAADEETVAGVRTWLQRAGLVLPTAFPFVEAAHAGLCERLPRMPEFYERACAIANALREHGGIHVSPDPPQATSFAVHVDRSYEDLLTARDAVLESSGIECFRSARRGEHAATASFEIVVGPRTMELSVAEIAHAIALLAGDRRFG